MGIKMLTQIEIITLENGSFVMINGYTGEIVPVTKKWLNDFSATYQVSFHITSTVFSSTNVVFSCVGIIKLREDVEKFLSNFYAQKVGA